PLEDRSQLLLSPGLELVQTAALLSVAPVELVEHALVEKRHQCLYRYARDGARSPEGRRRHGQIMGQLRAPDPDLLEIDRTQRLRICRAAKLAFLIDRLVLRLGLELGEVRIEAPGHHLVHEVEAVKSIAGIGDSAAGISLDAILLDIAPRERRAAEHHWH